MTKLYLNVRSAAALAGPGFPGRPRLPAPVISALGREPAVSGVYFGQEFCAELCPGKAELKKSLAVCRDKGLDFVYVTGPTGQKDIGRLRENLALLAAERKGLEVVFNDWGVLELLGADFPALKPVLGRLLVKNRRMAHFDGLPRAAGTPARVVKNQLAVLSRTNLDVAVYAGFLRGSRVRRVGLDLVRTGLDLEHIKDFKVDVYAPDAYVTGGRLCRLAKIFEPARGRHVLDKSCPRYCLKASIGFSPAHDERIHCRDNGIFLRHGELFLAGMLRRNRKTIDRLVYDQE